MDIKLNVVFDVSPKLEELVFHILATQFTKQEEKNVPKTEIKPEKTEPVESKPAVSEDKSPEEPVPEKKDFNIENIRSRVSEWMQKDEKANKPILVKWLNGHGLKRISEIKTAEMVADLEAVISA